MFLWQLLDHKSYQYLFKFLSWKYLTASATDFLVFTIIIQCSWRINLADRSSPRTIGSRLLSPEKKKWDSSLVNTNELNHTFIQITPLCGFIKYFFSRKKYFKKNMIEYLYFLNNNYIRAENYAEISTLNYFKYYENIFLRLMIWNFIIVFIIWKLLKYYEIMYKMIINLTNIKLILYIYTRTHGLCKSYYD